MSRVLVLLRLDTEDYLTPESNDAALALAELLNRLGIRATFPLVGEKVRFLLKEGRKDVLRALAGHEVGYHSDTHSRHPTLAEEMEGPGWEEGTRRFRKREEPGFLAVSEALDRLPACYTQPGGNWLPQAYPALRAWRVPLHYSEGWNSYLDLGADAYFYQGVLTWSAPVAAPKPFLSRLPEAEKEACALFRQEYERLLEKGGGLLNVVAHPTELVTTEYWDVLNFGGGVNHPPAVPSLRPAAEARAALESFQRYLEYCRSLPGVEFFTASELVSLHPSPGGRFPRVTELQAAARRVAREGEIGFLAMDRERNLSAAELFWLLTELALSGGSPPVAFPYLEGPGEGGPPPRRGRGGVSGADLLEAARWARESCLATGRIPALVPLGSLPVRPEEYLLALSRLLSSCPVNEARDLNVPLTTAPFRPLAFLKSEADLHWDWPVFRPGFRAERILEAAARQTWTLKPASPIGP